MGNEEGAAGHRRTRALRCVCTGPGGAPQEPHSSGGWPVLCKEGQPLPWCCSGCIWGQSSQGFKASVSSHPHDSRNHGSFLLTLGINSSRHLKPHQGNHFFSSCLLTGNFSLQKQPLLTLGPVLKYSDAKCTPREVRLFHSFAHLSETGGS